jgi:spore germination protein GerM
MMRGILKAIAVLIVAALGLLVFVPKASSPQPAVPQQEPVINLTLYFSNPDASALRQEQRQVLQTNEPARTAVEELLAGAKAEGSVTIIPAGTKLKGFALRQGVAYVDLSKDILNTPNRGSASESLIVASIVNTVTEFAGIDQVQILIDGKEVETLYGHMDLSEPFRRF